MSNIRIKPIASRKKAFVNLKAKAKSWLASGNEWQECSDSEALNIEQSSLDAYDLYRSWPDVSLP